MISPYTRRIRLGAELLALRTERQWTAQHLAALTGVKRHSISRLENGHGTTDVDLVMQILRLATVDEHRWTTLIGIARQAAERGWWECDAEAIGSRQARYANLEADAETISLQDRASSRPLELPTAHYVMPSSDFHLSGHRSSRRATQRGKMSSSLTKIGRPSIFDLVDSLKACSQRIFNN